MRESEIGGLTCSIARTVGVVGDPWSLLILREFFLGTHRFEDFQGYTGMSPRMLTMRLKSLEENGIIRRVPYSERPLRHEYHLTRKGMELHPVIVAMSDWGSTWMKEEGEKTPPVRFVHTKCGDTFSPVMTCSCCGEPVGPKDVEVKISRAMQAEREDMRADFLEAINRKSAA
jgi:DNA-binding HxlR family transcriptional regulator